MSGFNHARLFRFFICNVGIALCMAFQNANRLHAVVLLPASDIINYNLVLQICCYHSFSS